MNIIFFICSFLILCTLVFPLIRSTFWFIRAFDFPRFQIVLLVLLYLLTTPFYIENKIYISIAVVLSLLSLVLDIYRVGPYISLWKIESKISGKTQKPQIKILSANVFVNNTNYESLLKAVEKSDPDIVLLLEPDKEWENGVKKLEQTFEHVKLVPKDNTYGMLLYSKFELIDTEVKYLIDEKVPSIFTKVKLDNGQKVELICVHPRPPRPSESSSLQRDAELITVANYVKEKEGTPILILGDLNDVAWSHTTRLFKRVSGTLDPRIGRGFYNTFPVKWPFLRVPLDHIFHTPVLSMREIKVLKSIGSDHFPITVSFDLNNKDSGKANPEDESDREESKEVLNKGKKYKGPDEEVKKENE